jgi:uracil-DNA glycosylase family 4
MTRNSIFGTSKKMTDLSAVLTFRQHLRECTACPLHAQCKGPVPWRGDLNPEFAVMGEAPGRTEDARNEPFVGDTGNILNHWLKIKGFDPKVMTYFNAVQCYPKRLQPKPTAAEMKACRGWMNGQLEFIRPKILITLGVTAFESLIGGRWPELKLVHGKPLMHPTYGCWVWPCVDEKTKALTPQGWRGFEELSDGDLIAVVNPQTLTSSWEPASFHGYDYHDEMVVIDARSSSQWLSPNHRCLVRDRGQRQSVIEAWQLDPQQARHELPIRHQLLAEPSRSIGQDWAALVAWYITEGSIPHHTGSSIRIYQSLRTGHVETIRKLLYTVGATFKERNPRSDEYVFSVTGRVAERLRALAPGRTMTSAMAHLPYSEADAFLQAFIDGDGHRSTRRNREELSIIQKPGPTVDQLQILLARLGWRSIVRPHGDCVRIDINAKSWFQPYPQSLGTTSYQGTIWCPSTSSGFWVAQRDGFPFITGNTYHPSAYLRGRNKTYETKILNDLERLRIWWTNQEGGLDICYIASCDRPFYRYDDWAIGLCQHHAQRQGSLFPEDVGAR